MATINAQCWKVCVTGFDKAAPVGTGRSPEARWTASYRQPTPL